MADDIGDSHPTSEEMLRAARGEQSHEVSNAGERQADDDAASHPASNDGASGAPRHSTETRWLLRSGLIERPGSRMGRWNEPISWVGEATLIVDEEPVGTLTTDYEGLPPFRVTDVTFGDGSTWEISAEWPSGPMPQRRTIFGTVTERLHPVRSRIVVVRDGDRRLAETRGDLPPSSARARGEIVANGVGYAFTLPRSKNLARCGTTGEIRRGGLTSPDWLFATTERLPLAVMLLHWHIHIGDLPPPI